MISQENTELNRTLLSFIPFHSINLDQNKKQKFYLYVLLIEIQTMQIVKMYLLKKYFKSIIIYKLLAIFLLCNYIWLSIIAILAGKSLAR